MKKARVPARARTPARESKEVKSDPEEIERRAIEAGDRRRQEIRILSQKINSTDANRWFAHVWRAGSRPLPQPWLQEQLDRVTSPELFGHSCLSNIRKVRTLLYGIPIDPVSYIVTTFRISSDGGLSANYAYLYHLTHENYNRHNIYRTDERQSGIFTQFYCTAPSLVSQDGEYRSPLVFMGSESLSTIILESLFEKMYLDIEKYILSKLETDGLHLDYETFYPVTEDEQYGHTIDNRIVRNRLLIKIFIQFWFTEVALLSRGMQANNVNPKFNQIAFRDLRTDVQFFKDLCRKHTLEKVLTAARYSSQTSVNKTVSSDGKVEIRTAQYAIGQKIRPLNVNEVQEPLNIKYPAWREVLITRMASNITANFQSPSFPIILDWFYIKNSKPGLFDNEQQYRRLDFSQRAHHIVSKLRDTQRLTYASESKGEKEFLSDYFKQMYDGISEPIDFAKTHLMMSNVTLGFISEYVGRTFHDIPSMSRSAYWIDRVGNILQDHDIFEKHVWDIVYAVYCLNGNGIIHNDLHLNNCTITTYSTADETKGSKSEIYVVDDYVWKIPTRNNLYSCIIDMSRAIVMPERVRHFEAFRKTEEEYNEFVDDQVDRIIDHLVQLFPTSIRPVEAKLRSLLATDFTKIFRIYTAIDMYDFCGKLMRYIDGQTVRANMELLQRIFRIAEHYLTNILIRVINNPEIEVESPILVILKECFTRRMINPRVPDHDTGIVNVWHYNRASHWDLSRYETFPPWLQEGHFMDAAGRIHDSEYYVVNKQARLNLEKYRQKSMAMVRYIAERHQLKYS